jgi:hypothetical protein
MSDNGDSERSTYRRFGGAWGWTINRDGDERRLSIGEAIQSAGPGEGVVMLPWALDHYEAALRLKPGESWLLRRMLAHVWTYGGQVYLSLRKISFESGVSRTTLHTYVKKLVKLGLIRRIPDEERELKDGDKRVCYDVSPTYAALAIAIACDPHSEWSKANGGPIPREVANTLGTGTRRPPHNFSALDKLEARRRKDAT